MGKRNTQRKNAAMLDSDDDGSSVSPLLSIARLERLSVSGAEDVQLDRDSLLEQALDALYEKRGSTREKALAAIIEAFNSNLQYQFVGKKLATLLHQCLSCTKKGSGKEIALASHAIGMLALTVGYGDGAREILKESITPITQALKSVSDPATTVSLLECLAIVTFVGENDPGEIERSMQVIWQLVHPKLGTNVVAVKPSSAVISAVVSAWAFLLTTMDESLLNAKDWQESISYFSNLLDKGDRSVRIATGEVLAIIFEMGSLEKFAAEAKSLTSGLGQERNKSREGFSHIHGLKVKILNQVQKLSAEAGGKCSNKKDLNGQRNLFKGVLEFLEDGGCPETTTKVGGDVLQTSSWSQLIQLKYLKHFLGGGFAKHIQDNEFLHEVLGFTPKRKLLQGYDLSSERITLLHRLEHYISFHPAREELCLKNRSPNSALKKARTQYLNKQRVLSEVRNIGYFKVDAGDQEAC